MNDHVILCGAGRAGFRVLEELVKLGEEVLVIEKQPADSVLSFSRQHGIPVHLSRVPNESLLHEVGVERAKSIILCTNDDLANLEAALDARRANKRIRIVLRMYDQDLAAKVRDTMDIDAAFSRSDLAAPVFASSSSDPSVTNAFYVGKRLLLVAEVAIRPRAKLVGMTVGELRDQLRVVVLAHSSKGRPGFWPQESSTLGEGDVLTLQTEPPSLRRFHQWNQPA